MFNEKETYVSVRLNLKLSSLKKILISRLLNTFVSKVNYKLYKINIKWNINIYRLRYKISIFYSSLIRESIKLVELRKFSELKIIACAVKIQILNQRGTYCDATHL